MLQIVPAQRRNCICEDLLVLSTILWYLWLCDLCEETCDLCELCRMFDVYDDCVNSVMYMWWLCDICSVCLDGIAKTNKKEVFWSLYRVLHLAKWPEYPFLFFIIPSKQTKHILHNHHIYIIEFTEPSHTSDTWHSSQRSHVSS